MPKRNTFRPGRSTYPCACCGRLTRETGAQSLGSDLCPECYDLAGIENDWSDGHCTEEAAAVDARPLVDEVERKGGDASYWRRLFKL